MDARGGRRRSGPIRRSGPGTYIPFSPGPFQAPRSPRVVQAHRKAWGNHRVDHLPVDGGASTLGLGYREFSLEGGLLWAPGSLGRSLHRRPFVKPPVDPGPRRAVVESIPSIGVLSSFVLSLGPRTENLKAGQPSVRGLH